MDKLQAAKDAAFTTARREIDESSFGNFVSDEKCRGFSDAIAVAVVTAIAALDAAPANPNQPLSPT